MKKQILRVLTALSLSLSLIMGLGATTAPALARDLISIMQKDIGDRRPGGCPSKWCACYMNLTLKKAGHKTIPSNRARDFAQYGRKATPMSKGSIMVMRQHVGVVAGKCEDGRIKLLSGNHSRKVAWGCYHPKKAIAWRKPS